MKLFDRDGNGAEEIVKAVGLISNDISFDKWEPLLPFGIREVSAIVGHYAVSHLAAGYEGGTLNDDEKQALAYLQQAVAFFTWLRVIPTLDAQHNASGRGHRVGENEKSMTALEQFKDEENIQRMAYDAVDALVECMDLCEFDFWLKSQKYRQRKGLLIQSREDFDKYYHIGSSRLFLTLLPMLHEVQAAEILPALGVNLLEEIISDTYCEGVHSQIETVARRALALLTMKKAVERLPVQVIPEGVVQVQQSQPVKSRLRAEKEARLAVAAALGTDGGCYLRQLSILVAQEQGEAQIEQAYIRTPINHSTGFSF